MKRKSYGLLFLIVTLFFAGCATQKANLPLDSVSPPPSRIDTDKIKKLSFPQVKEHILYEEGKIMSIKSKVAITLEAPATNGPFSCQGVFALQKPEKIRVIGFKLATTVFNMISDGVSFWFYLPKQKTVYAGKCNSKRVANDNAFIFPDDIAVLLDHGKLFEGRSAFMETWSTFWLIHIIATDGESFIPYGRLKIDRIDCTISELTLFQPDSHIKVQASFSDYVSIDGHTIPKEIKINWPDPGTTLNITFKNPSINENLKPEVFQFKKPKKSETIQVN
ncbi:MAG: DUF4292 domain-containing protein [Planctomycetes bacterium]|nr:DUF4292 domain-containing protein [Planctomycetota bacterium]